MNGKIIAAALTAGLFAWFPAALKHAAAAEPSPGGVAAAANLLKAPIALDAEAQADLKHIRAETKVGAPYFLDMRNPAHYRHILRTLKRAGETPDKSPRLFAMLEAASHQPGPDGKALAVVPSAKAAVTDNGTADAINFINYIGSTGNRSFAASSLSSIAGGTQSTTVLTTLYGYGADGKEIVYATNTGNTYTAGNYFQVAAAGTMSAEITGNVTQAEGSFIYVPNGSTSPYPTVIYYNTQDEVNPSSGCMNLPQYCVRDTGDNCIAGQYQTQCTNNVNNTTPIKACWNRGSQQECDYWNAGAHPASYFFPIQGSAVFDTPIFTTGGAPSGAQNIVLINPTYGGGCYLYFQEAQPLGTGWSVSTTGTTTNNTLNFNFPEGTFPNTNNCITSGATNTILTVQVDALVMADNSAGSFRFTSDRLLAGQPGVRLIPGMQIQDGCFAAGTLIRMADGSQKRIETVTRDDKVMTGDGHAVAVRDITSGVEPKPMIRVKTAEGADILVTRTHPFLTADGAVMAQNLKAFQQLKAADGKTAIVSSVTSEMYDGQVFNLRIGDEADALAGRTMLVANGLQAGDVAAQQLIERQEAQPKLASADELSQVHPDWREDYLRHRASAQ